MAASPRRTAESKAKAVELYESAGPGTTYAEVARGPGCDPGSLSKRVRMADGPDTSGAEMNPFQLAEENRRLKRELARAKEENGMLLKAGASFAGKQLRRRPGSRSCVQASASTPCPRRAGRSASRARATANGHPGPIPPTTCAISSSQGS